MPGHSPISKLFSVRVIITLCLITIGHLTAFSQMSGNYLVKGDGTGNFLTLQAAATALKQQGVNGPVTINIFSGSYDEQVIIDSIPGTSASNVVTFRSQIGNASSVTIFTTQATSQTKYVIQLQNVQHITLEHLTIHNNTPSNHQALVLAGNCRNILVRNNIIQGGSPTGAGSDFVVGINFFIDMNTFRMAEPVGPYYFHNNTIEHGSGGLSAQGGWTDTLIYVEVDGNLIKTRQGLHLYLVDSVTVSNNTLDGLTFQDIGAGFNQVRAARIYNNRFYRHTRSLTFSLSALDRPIYIYNNIMSVKGEAALLFMTVGEFYVYHNSILNNRNSPGYIISDGFGLTDSFVVMENNILCNYGKGGIVLGQEKLLKVSDYNAFFTTQDSFHADFAQVVSATFANWKTNTGLDQNSIYTDPFFDSDTTLVPLSTSLKGAGKFIPWITTDINGAPRDPNNITIGAIEQTNVPNLVPQVVQATPDTVFTGNGLQISYTVKNDGNASIQGAWLDALYLSTSSSISDTVVRLLRPANNRLLNTGVTYQRTVAAGVPDTMTGGIYYVLLLVNQNAGVNEDRNDNALASLPVRVVPKDRPNLRVTSVSVPPAIQSGQVVRITWTVANNGTVPTSGTWFDYLYWHNDSSYFVNPAVFKPDSMRLFAVQAPSGLLPGQSYTQSKDYRLPLQMSGVYFAAVFTDGARQVLEEIEGTPDNIGLKSINVSQLPLADLEVMEVNVPATIFSGEQLHFSYKVRNSGSAKTAIDRRADRIVLSRDSVPDERTLRNPVRAKNITRTYPLDPLQEHIVQDSILLPFCTSGKYYLYVLTNRDDLVPEITNANNLNSDGPVEVVLLPNPDLIVSQVSVLTPQPRTEMPITIEYTIKNDGFSTAYLSRYYTDALYMYQSATFDSALAERVGFRNFLEPFTLGVGADTTIRTSFTIPAKRFGQQYVHVYTDIGQKVCELPYEHNNVGNSPAIQVQLAPLKDLVVNNLTVSGSMVAGEPITISYTARNNGPGDVALYPVIDSIFLMPAGGQPSKSNFLALYKHDSLLTGNTSVPVTLSRNIPVLLASGNYEILVRTDARDDVYEHQAEHNNDGRSASFAVSRDLNNLPDLSATQISIQGQANSGQSLSFSYSVRNLTTKTTPVASWEDRVELLRPDNTIVVGRTLMRHSELVGNQQYTVQSTLAIPHGIEGPFMLRIKADNKNRVTEYNTTNNVRTIPVTVQLSPWPDLQISKLNNPDTLIDGQMNLVPYTLLNAGTGAADTPWIDRLYLSTDEFLDPFDLRIYSERPATNGLAPSATYNENRPFRLQGVPSGYYFLIAQTDARNQVYEHTAEDNNIRVSNSQVYLHKPLPADLSPVPDSIILASSQYIPYQVRNSGPNPAQGSWTDVVYLSQDTILDEWDHYVGAVQIDTPSLPVGGRYNAYWSGNLPFVEPGWYYVLVKTDAFNYIPETDLTNNVRASAVAYYIDPVTPLTPNVPYDTAFPKFGWKQHYYSVGVQPGEGIIMRLDAHTPSTGMELYYRKDALPYRGGPFDARGANAFQPSQRLLVPSDTAAYTGYSLVRQEFSYSDSVPYTIIAETRTFSLESVMPTKGGNEGIVVLNIDGFDLSDSMRVMLRGATDSMEAHHVFPFGPIEARAHINLNDVAPGVYDLVLERLDKGGTTVLPQAFTIEDTSYQEFYLETMSPDMVLINRAFPVTVNFANLGNINDYDIVLAIAIYRDDFKADSFTVEYMGDGISNTLPPAAAVLHPFDSTALMKFEDGYLLLAWYPVLPSQGWSNFTFRITGQIDDTIVVATNIFRNPISEIHFSGHLDDLEKTYFMRSLLDIITPEDPLQAGFRSGKCNTDPAQLEAVIWAGVRQHAQTVSGGLPTNPTALAGNLLENAVKNTFNPEVSPEPTAVVQDLVEGWKGPKKYVEGLVPGGNSYYEYLVNNLGDCLDMNDITQRIEDHCVHSDKRPRSDGRGYETVRYISCPKNIPPPRNPPKIPWRKRIPILRSFDPNEIVGPEGTGAPRYVYTNESLQYTVHFENMATAGAPAQFVSIENPLPPTFDIRQFRLGEVGWGDTSIILPEAAYYTGSVSLGPKYFNHRLDIVAGIDVLNHKAFWRFTTIDPATGARPLNPMAGFLPPNDSSGIGQGFVRYRIMAIDTLSPGTVLANQADIIFDAEAMIATNIWENTIIQEGGLYSFVLPRPAFTDSTTFLVRWEAGYIDSFCADLDRVEVFVAEDSMPYRLWASSRTDREGWFTGKRGSTYQFFSLAISQDNSIEYKMSSSAEATTTIDTATGIDQPLAPGWQRPELAVYPNPTRNLVNITLDLTMAGHVRLPVYDLQGREVALLHSGNLPTGNHRFTWSPEAQGLAPGLYLVQCFSADGVVGTKVLFLK